MKSEYQILNQITPENANPYSIPVEYFDGLANAFLTKIKSKEAIYAIPPNYFESLPFQVLQKIQQAEKRNEITEELVLFAPFLNTISKANVYQINAPYFENLRTVDLVKNGKVVKSKTPFKWLKYAAAAAVIGVISLSIFSLNTKKDDIQILASYHQALKTNVEKSVVNISDTDLNTEVETDKSSYVSADETNILPWNSLDNLQDEIQFITDEEIDFYIKENKIVAEETSSTNSKNI